MRERSGLVTLAALMGLSLAGCGGGEEALAHAAQACNEAMAKQSGRTDGEILATRRAAADTAAEAASADDRWSDLAKATSDWAAMTENLTDPDRSSSLEEAERLGERIEQVRSTLLAECRAANVAGGDVDDEILDEFTSLLDLPAWGG